MLPPGGYVAWLMSEQPVFSASLVDEGGARRLVLTGELDVATAPELEAALAEVEPGTTVDALALSFCDSTGLSRLLAGARRYEEAGEQMVVLASAALRRTLDLAGVAARFELRDGEG